MKPDIVIESLPGGKRTGQGLVFFSSEERAKKAKEELDKKNLGNRYVEVFDHTDVIMQQACGLQVEQQTNND
jgi:hypothetical protein